jgi:hypothetical protein
MTDQLTTEAIYLRLGSLIATPDLKANPTPETQPLGRTRRDASWCASVPSRIRGRAEPAVASTSFVHFLLFVYCQPRGQVTTGLRSLSRH